MKKRILTLAGVLAAATALMFGAAEEKSANWLTDYEAAAALAAKESKPVMVVFTGSDWCPPCIVMWKTVFASDAFISYADKNLVLVKVDFQKMEDITGKALAKHSPLAAKYKIYAFPTMLLLSKDQVEIDRMTGAKTENVLLTWLKDNAQK